MENAAEKEGTIERLFSRDVASEIPTKAPLMEAGTDNYYSADFGAHSPLERVFSRDATEDLASMDDAPVPPPLERLFSRDAVEDLPAEGVSLTSQHILTTFERVLLAANSTANENTAQTAATQTTPDRGDTMSPTSILDTDGGSTEGETPASVSTVTELEALLFSPSGPREGAAPIPEGPRGMEHFRSALDAHVRPSPRSLDPQMLARRDLYEAALLELNSQFKARWLDFDQSVAMAEPHSYSAEAALTPGKNPTEQSEDASISTPVRGNRSSVNSRLAPPSPLLVASHTFDPVLNCPTPPGALTAPASPPLSTEELSAYLASLGITIAAEKARTLVAGYQEEANEGVPRVQMQRLRKDMRVAVARSLRPVPSPRGSFVGANAAVAGSPGGATDSTDAITAALDALPLPSLAPVNTRISSSASLSKNKSPAGGKSASGLSEESPCIWSPKVGVSGRPLGATPPAIVEAVEDDNSGQALA